ncbi:MAG: CDP-alcohol phosphatidyltransferase family protein [Coriobacteriales bacterium]|nr:CDP-alcohol phosphatidyltransferase family protein [Coriobacteriales bacterium]
MISDTGQMQQQINNNAQEPVLGSPENPLHTLKTIPNLITLFRLILTVAFLIMYQFEDLRIASICIYIVAASTDWFDGQIARRFNQVSVFGKRFDPIMDRVLIFSAVLALLFAGLIPVWIVVFIIARDVYLFLGGSYVLKKTHTVIDVVFIGKACTFVLMAGFAVQLLQIFIVPGLNLFEASWLPGFGSEPVSIGIWIIYIGCILSFITACVYTAKGLKLIKESTSQDM